MTKLSELTIIVRILEETIQKLRKQMSKACVGSVNILRKNVNELENILELILNEPVSSETDIEHALTKGNDCIKECIRPIYTGKISHIPHAQLPFDNSNTSPPTINGFHLILYLDATAGMQSYYKGQLGESLKRLADYLTNQCSLYSIPGTFSLVCFGDTNSSNPYEIVENGLPLSKISNALSIPRQLSSGGSISQSGLYTIAKTIETVYNPVVKNTIVFVTDAASKDIDFGVTPQTVDNKLTSLNINIRFGVIPTKRLPDISFIFNEVRNIQYNNSSYNLVPWGYTALHP